MWNPKISTATGHELKIPKLGSFCVIQGGQKRRKMGLQSRHSSLPQSLSPLNHHRHATYVYGVESVDDVRLDVLSDHEQTEKLKREEKKLREQVIEYGQSYF